MRIFALTAMAVLAGIVAAQASSAQQRPPMGTLPTADARVNGQVEVSGNQAALISNVSVTVYDEAAPVTLGRGGELLVCSTSEFHLLRSSPGESLVFGLDRGALELRSGTETGDLVLTPDLKFTPVTKGRYDLRLRVTREGDTCVENDGANAPVLNATDAFSAESYRILPGQHLLFVKGDLHSVVDHERSPCGCPASTRQMVAHKPGEPVTAAEAHPFPEAQSQGLAPSAGGANAMPVGTAGSQVTTTFSYGDGAKPPPGMPALGQAGGPPVLPPPEEPHGFFHAIGHFFHKLFHPKS